MWPWAGPSSSLGLMSTLSLRAVGLHYSDHETLPVAQLFKEMHRTRTRMLPHPQLITENRDGIAVTLK